MASVPGKQVQNGVYEFDDYMRVPDTRTRWQVMKDGIYNPAEGTYLGKSSKQWGVTGLFYLAFFSGLAVFCSICTYGFLQTLSYEKPRWTLDSSLIGTNPGLGFRPVPPTTEQRSLIWYHAQNDSEIQAWISNIDEFLENYINSSKLPNGGRNQQMCDYHQQTRQEGKVCAVEVQKWKACSPAQGYGFKHSSPCIFIKLNRIYGWVPDYYNNPNDLPSDMPKTLVNTIKNASANALNTVWISCDGADPFDRENVGPIEYFPDSQGFPGFYYPYENTPGYLSPLVAVHFKRPEPNRIIAVECRAWAKNIKYDPSLKLGMVHFELLIDQAGNYSIAPKM